MSARVYDHRATVDGIGAASGLSANEALTQVRAWLTTSVEASLERGHGVPVGLAGRVERRREGGPWMPWRTLRVRQEPGENGYRIVRADR